MAIFKSKQQGFTLIEIIVAIAILLVVLLTLVPLFVFAQKTAQVNTRNTVAANLANAKLEEFRGSNFESIAIGEVELPVTIDGCAYKVKTMVSWWDESHGAKVVQVEVTAPAVGRENAVRQKMETLISETSGEIKLPESGISVRAALGWNPQKPVPGAAIDIVDKIGSPVSSGITDTQGLAEFQLQPYSSYDIQINLEESGLLNPYWTEVFIAKTGQIWDGSLTSGQWLSLITYLMGVPPAPDKDWDDPDTIVDGVIDARHEELIWLSGGSGGSDNINKNPKSNTATIDDYLLTVIWNSNQKLTITLQAQEPLYIAAEMYFNTRVYIHSGATLRLEANLLRFAEAVLVESEKNENQPNGRIELSIPQGESGISGSNIPGGLPDTKYGIVSFDQGLYIGEEEDGFPHISTGTYFFPKGTTLPDDYSKLIRWE